jgi:hypothetical protein
MALHYLRWVRAGGTRSPGWGGRKENRVRVFEVGSSRTMRTFLGENIQHPEFREVGDLRHPERAKEVGSEGKAILVEWRIRPTKQRWVGSTA